MGSDETERAALPIFRHALGHSTSDLEARVLQHLKRTVLQRSIGKLEESERW
jgi:hypothetical protein